MVRGENEEIVGITKHTVYVVFRTPDQHHLRFPWWLLLVVWCVVYFAILVYFGLFIVQRLNSSSQSCAARLTTVRAFRIRSIL